MENKRKYGLWLDPKTYEKVDKIYKESNCSTRNEFIQNAIEFYMGYLQHESNFNFLSPVLSGIIKGTVQTSENRLSRLLYKTAVELAKLTEITAALNRIDTDTLARLHVRCVNEVNRINGVIKFEDAVKFQHGGGDQ